MPPLIMCRYNGVIPYNMPLLTTNIRIVSVLFPYRFRIVSVSFPYRFRIVSVSFPYRFRIVSVLFSYCSPIVLLLFSYWEAETIRNRYGIERMTNGGTRVVNLTIIVNSYENGKTQTNYCGGKHVIYRLIT